MLYELSEYLAMGGDARFIWTAYAVALIVLAGMLMMSVSSYRSTRSKLGALEKVARRQSSDQNTGVNQ